MTKKKVVYSAFRAALPSTIPILASFLFLGIAYGIFMNVSGFHALYAIAMSLLIFAGSMEFVAVNLLLGAFNPLGALFLTVMVNARHLFYGISMLEKYKGTGLKKFYLIFGLCDETFSINYAADIPRGVDKGWYMFFVTLLNHVYWVLGAAIGGLFGSLVQFNMEGLEFVMTALFVVIFIEQWKKESRHHSALLGLGMTLLCLLVFGSRNFILPSMIGILCILTLMRKQLEATGEAGWK
ncbi:azaleucine resistance protein AzlC [Paenibacillus sp. GYB003]|uniref:azaleucine resistance protein AzlC n=1 Tax=Paenibacillus sp. GYB003 TaxID=2994392 RepID=UPI002F96D3AC